MCLLHVVNDNVMIHMWVCIYEKVGCYLIWGGVVYHIWLESVNVSTLYLLI